MLTKKIKDRNCKVNACSGVREVPLHGVVRKGLETAAKAKHQGSLRCEAHEAAVKFSVLERLRNPVWLELAEQGSPRSLAWGDGAPPFRILQVRSLDLIQRVMKAHPWNQAGRVRGGSGIQGVCHTCNSTDLDPAVGSGAHSQELCLLESLLAEMHDVLSYHLVCIIVRQSITQVLNKQIWPLSGKSQCPISLFSRGLSYPWVTFEILRRGVYPPPFLVPIYESWKEMILQCLKYPGRALALLRMFMHAGVSLSPSLSALNIYTSLCFSGRRPFLLSAFDF